MDKLSKKVKILWNKKENGGKKILPLGIYYVITEEIKGDNVYAWSIVLNIESNSFEEGEWIGHGFAKFLVDKAPNYLLEKGCLTKIFEGKIYVGEILVM